MFSYFSDEEYQNAFSEFGMVRAKISTLLRERTSFDAGRILDLLSGHGYLAAEVAKNFPQCIIHCTGLRNDLESFLALRNSKLYPASIWANVRYVECDTTALPFNDAYFDVVCNFLGLEDVVMTRGESGLLLTISEVSRVIKKDGLIQITVVEYGDSPEEKVAEDIWASIGLNAVFLSKDFYIESFAEQGFNLAEEKILEIRKKMTLEQAKEELRFACEEAPSIFKDYGVYAIEFEELMDMFESRIGQHGMAYYPNIHVLLFLPPR